MGNPVVGEDGRLELGSVNTLSRKELTNWICLRLHGKDHFVPSDIKQAEPGYYLLASIYPYLERDSRSYMRSAVEQFLNEMAQGDASWHGEAADSLLLLAQGLKEPEFVAPIKRMAEDSLFFDNDAGRDIDAIHHRLLQSLVALRWTGSLAFWQTQFDRSPTTYAAVVFAGLNIISIHHAMQLLPRVPWEDANTRRAMRVALRGLLPAYDHTVIGIVLSRVLRVLEPSQRSIVENMLPEVPWHVRALFEPAGESIGRLERSKPNRTVAILDFGMPDMDGLEVMQTIQEMKLPGAVIVLTAHEQGLFSDPRSVQNEKTGHQRSSDSWANMTSVLAGSYIGLRGAATK